MTDDQQDLFGAPPAGGGGSKAGRRGRSGTPGGDRVGGGGRGGSHPPAPRPGAAGPEAPLAERMRPRTLDEVVGQEHVVGAGKLLRRAIERDDVPSMIFWGPPGTGKTTLARVIAETTHREFVPFSAVLGGVQDVREIVADARARLAQGGDRTILFVDEIHRFNRAQQDAFLPHVEQGTITLVGATTENPSFALSPALLSRARVYVLAPLGPEQVRVLLDRALAEPERGLARLGIAVDPEALEHLSAGCFGDARRALSALEVAAAAAASREDRTLRLADAEEALARRSLAHDRAGEQHFDLASALIKSLRNSDPDAAIYYAARLLEAGEDPRFVIRRLVIFAAEDVGLADPRALAVAVDCLHAFELVGWPEGHLPISMAVCYLAAAPKSNSALTAYAAAKEAVQEKGPLPVPLAIRNAPTGLMKQLGYGGGYVYPHDAPGRHVPVDYLPDELAGRTFFEPTDQGLEKSLGERVRAIRARVAAARTRPAGGDEREP